MLSEGKTVGCRGFVGASLSGIVQGINRCREKLATDGALFPRWECLRCELYGAASGASLDALLFLINRLRRCRYAFYSETLPLLFLVNRTSRLGCDERNTHLDHKHQRR